ncbi:MAG: HYR domain-containing protein [Candidatus Nitrosomaritimum yanchengensis]
MIQYSLAIFFAILLTATSLMQVMAQEDTKIQLPLSIDAHTNQNFYEYGESVGVSGKIKNYDADLHSGISVEYRVLNPSGDLVKSGQTDPGQFGAFSFNFITKGTSFETSGNYSIHITFDTVETELPMFFTGGVPIVEDVTPPEIVQHEDIVVLAETSGALTPVEFDVLVIDDMDESITPTCKPESGFLFGIGQTIIKCTAKDSAGNFATPMSFSIIVSPPLTSIPSWVKNVAGFWCQNQIDDASFVEGIQYLIDNGIIVVPAKSKVISDTQEVPQWVKNNACWWSEGSITDLDFASGIEYLVREGIIVV